MSKLGKAAGGGTPVPWLCSAPSQLTFGCLLGDPEEPLSLPTLPRVPLASGTDLGGQSSCPVSALCPVRKFLQSEAPEMATPHPVLCASLAVSPSVLPRTAATGTVEMWLVLVRT